MKHISTKRGLKKLLERYQQAGVTDQTKDITGTYEAKWISAIKDCINEGLAMDEIDYENTPLNLRELWVGLM